MVVVRIAVACAVGWVTTPFVVLHRRGTIDEQHRASIREEARRVAAARRATTSTAPPTARESAATGDPEVATVPAPRGALDEVRAIPT